MKRYLDRSVKICDACVSHLWEGRRVAVRGAQHARPPMGCGRQPASGERNRGEIGGEAWFGNGKEVAD